MEPRRICSSKSHVIPFESGCGGTWCGGTGCLQLSNLQLISQRPASRRAELSFYRSLHR